MGIISESSSHRSPIGVSLVGDVEFVSCVIQELCQVNRSDCQILLISIFCLNLVNDLLVSPYTLGIHFNSSLELFRSINILVIYPLSVLNVGSLVLSAIVERFQLILSKLAVQNTEVLD